GRVLRAIGPLLSWLKKSWILLIITFVGAVIAVIGPVWLGTSHWDWLRMTAGIAAAAAIVADKVADHYDKVIATRTFRESEQSAEKAVDDLNVVLSEAIEVMALSGSGRNAAEAALRRTLARQAASAIGDGSRATYYSLRRDQNGLRI